MGLTLIDQRQLKSSGGVSADGVTNDQAILQAVINDMAANGGGTVQLPPGDTLLDGSGTELLKLPGPYTVNLVGSWASRLVIKSTVGATVDVIRVCSITEGIPGVVLSGFQIVAQSGTPARHGIVFDTTDRYCANVLVDHVRIYSLGGKSIVSVNPTLTDGFFTSTITDCLLYGGTKFTRVGDALNFIRTVIAGAGIGVEVESFVPGARGLVLDGCTITSAVAAVKIGEYFVDCTIVNSRLEAPAGATGSNGAYVDIDGGTTGGTCFKIINSSISTLAVSTISGLRIDFATDTYIDGVTFQKHASGANCWFTTASALRTRIGRQNIYMGGYKYPDTWLDAGVHTTVEPIAQSYTITGAQLVGAVAAIEIDLFTHPIGAFFEGIRIEINTAFTATNMTALLVTLGDTATGLGYFDPTGLALVTPTQLVRMLSPPANSGLANQFGSQALAYFSATFSDAGTFTAHPVTGSVTVTFVWGLKPMAQ